MGTPSIESAPEPEHRRTPMNYPPKKHPTNLAEEIEKSRPFDLPAQEAYLNLVRSKSILSEHFAVLFREHGLTESQYNVLRIIASAATPGIRIEAIRLRLVERGPDVSRIIDRLERRGLVQRVIDPDDRRARRIVLEESGERLLGHLRPRIDRVHREHLSHLTEAEIGTLNELLFRARHPEG